MINPNTARYNHSVVLAALEANRAWDAETSWDEALATAADNWGVATDDVDAAACHMALPDLAR